MRARSDGFNRHCANYGARAQVHGLSATEPTYVHHRAGVAFEALAQSNKLHLVREEANIIVGNLVGEDEPEAGWRRHVTAT